MIKFIISIICIVVLSACSSSQTPAPAPTPVSPRTIKSLIVGDAACYVESTDETGTIKNDMALFEICEMGKPLVGSHVVFDYRKEKVIADSCMGDPECQDHKLVDLIVGIKVMP